MTQPKFIYFDVGGVAIKDFSDSNKWQDMQRDLGVTSDNQKLFDSVWATHRKEICLDYDVDNYVPIIREKINNDIAADYSMLQDFVDRFAPNDYLKPVISELKKTYKLGLLTNMYPRMLDAIFARTELGLSRDWDSIVDSSKVLAQKPEIKIFEIATQMAKVNKKEIIFVDNSQDNIDAAMNFGWQGFFYDSKDYEKSSRELAQLLSL